MKVTLNKVIDIALKQSKLPAMSPHRFDHWSRVHQNAQLLSKQYNDVDEKVIMAFSYLHDCKRKNDGVDFIHGRDAAEFIDTLNLDLTKDQLSILKIACEFHTDGKTRNLNNTIAVCWDADRLDIGRVGIMPEPKYMCTSLGKYIARKMQEARDITIYELNSKN